MNKAFEVSKVMGALEIKTHEIGPGNVLEVGYLEAMKVLMDPDVEGGAKNMMLTTQIFAATKHMIGEGMVAVASGEAAIVGIPRGGLAAAYGSGLAFSEAGVGLGLHVSNAGARKDPTLPLLSPDSMNGGLLGVVVLADYVIGSGTEMERHIDEAMRLLPDGWGGQLVVVSAVGAELGLGNIVQHVAENYPGLNFIQATGRVVPEDKCQGWVNVGDEENENMVYFVGVGDAGQAAEAAFSSTEDLYKYYETRFKELSGR